MSFIQRIQKLASETAIYGISSIVGRALKFLIFPFYTQYFKSDRLGVYVAAYAGFIVFNIIYTYGMEAGYLKFASGKEGRSRASRVFSTVTWMLVGTSIVLSGLFLLFKGTIAEVIQLEVHWHHLLNYIVIILVLDTIAVVHSRAGLQLRESRRGADLPGLRYDRNDDGYTTPHQA